LKALLQPLLKSDVPLIIKLTNGHTADALQVLAHDGTELFVVDKDGATTPAGGSEFLDNAFAIKDSADDTKVAAFQCGGITAGQTRTLTVPDYDGTIATLAGAESLTNKTLASPKVTTAILDANGLELLKVTATGTAVNELTLANAAADGAPTISATGDDTHIGIKLAPKGAQGRVLVTTAILQGQTASALNTASNLAYTAAQILGGLVLRDCNGSNRADTLPTAAALVADLPGAVAGMAFDFALRNTSDAAETITATAPDASVTISGTATVAQNNTKLWRIVLTNVGAATEAYTAYSLGTFVH
jgi:hypothetical protein